MVHLFHIWAQLSDNILVRAKCIRSFQLIYCEVTHFQWLLAPFWRSDFFYEKSRRVLEKVILQLESKPTLKVPKRFVHFKLFTVKCRISSSSSRLNLKVWFYYKEVRRVQEKVFLQLESKPTVKGPCKLFVHFNMTHFQQQLGPLWRSDFLQRRQDSSENRYCFS